MGIGAGRRQDATWPAGLLRLRDPRRAIAIAILGLVGGLMVMVLYIHRDAAGADALAYWHAARTWLAGGDPYRPEGPWLPWVYAPWLLPLFVPWALLPWPVAWAAWSGTMVALLAWTLAWAYERRPLPAAIAFLVLSIPIGVVLDSANIALFLTFGLWALWFAGPKVAAALWAAATVIKWFPAIFFVALPRAARPWALALLAMAVALSLLTWPLTLEQLELVGLMGVPKLDYGSRGWRIDHLVFLWALIPWLWGAAVVRGIPRPLARWSASLHRPRTHRPSVA